MAQRYLDAVEDLCEAQDNGTDYAFPYATASDKERTYKELQRIRRKQARAYGADIERNSDKIVSHKYQGRKLDDMDLEQVKSLREGKASLVDGFAVFYRDELWLEQVYIPEYLNGSWTNHAARRRRKLLLHRAELTKISRQIQDPGLTIVPLSLYFLNGRVKVEIGVARGNREYDKRHKLREQQDNREAQRAMRMRNRRAGVA